MVVYFSFGGGGGWRGKPLPLVAVESFEFDTLTF